MDAEMMKEIVRCVCGTWTKPRFLRIEGLRIRGSTCPKCGESYLNPEDTVMLSEFRRLKDSVLEGRMGRTGNSFALRLPIGLVRALGLREGSSVKIRVKGPKEIVITVP